MITYEAEIQGKEIKRNELCLTCPHDGGSRERNAKQIEEWKEKVKRENPGAQITFAVYSD